jgi:nitroimidazol reductase NimA-like FMN-containing flavoprotein (pyridoxamine 5'-phosphate oxidase superfamily)
MSPTSRMMPRAVTFKRDARGTFGAMADAPFDVHQFLSQPLVARLAVNGPVVRPVWFLWEDENFWVITGHWSSLRARLRADPAVELCVDTCDLDTGRVRQVIARGRGSLASWEPGRARRKLKRYLGPDEAMWDPRFRVTDDPSETSSEWAVLLPDRLRVSDLSFVPSLVRPPTAL